MRESHEVSIPIVHLAPRHKLSLGFFGLLDALEQPLDAVQMVLPANQVLRCPVAVSTFDRSGTVFRYFLQELFDDGRARVISIDEYGETKRVR